MNIKMYSKTFDCYIPLTASTEEWLEAPALFDAVQVYSPECLAATESIANIL